MGPISLELLYDTLGMNEIAQGEWVEGRDPDLGLSASVQEELHVLGRAHQHGLLLDLLLQLQPQR